ncbi:hypothetical protein NDU88_003223 [Pleurodeles waltl]|uniref:Uncharacterized protein n=1 Tax=Pleurodeles waltl TaxID=8319 RepID=A0AAV7KVW7_PLEWA|nr:hypothetical protein NDU88_003223 [Pleurodeles waltl]
MFWGLLQSQRACPITEAQCARGGPPLRCCLSSDARCTPTTQARGRSGPPQASMPSEVSSPRQDIVRVSVPLRPLCMGLEAAPGLVLLAEITPRPDR